MSLKITIEGGDALSRVTLEQEILCLCEYLGVTVDFVHTQHGQGDELTLLADEEHEGDDLQDRRRERLASLELTAEVHTRP